jgi:hypothetical protein
MDIGLDRGDEHSAPETYNGDDLAAIPRQLESPNEREASPEQMSNAHDYSPRQNGLGTHEDLSAPSTPTQYPPEDPFSNTPPRLHHAGSDDNEQNLPSAFSPRMLASPRMAAQHLNPSPGPSRRNQSFEFPTRSPIHSPQASRSSFDDHKPALPLKSFSLFAEESYDPTNRTQSAPFESIPLQASPPHSTFIPPFSDPGLNPPGSKRASWNGFGGIKPNGALTSESTPALHGSETLPDPIPEDRSASAGPSTPPRRHAPPAHPHPFPNPSSPTASTSKRSREPVSPSVPIALGTKGRSVLEKVVSHTRPAYLPPKDRSEDATHYKQWESMMASARDGESAARKLREQKRLEKEKKLAISVPQWEALLGSDFSVNKVKENEVLRKLWFEGVPSHLRGKAWSAAIGNPLAMSKGR